MAGSWILRKADAGFPARDSAHNFKWMGEVYVSNGYVYGGVPPLRDLWRSPDGERWIQVLAATPYDAYSGMAVLGNHIYAVNKTVWRSNNPTTWTQTGVSPLANEGLPWLHAMSGRLWLTAWSGMWSAIPAADGSCEWEPWACPTGPAFGMANGDYAQVEDAGAIYRFGGSYPDTGATPGGGYKDRRATNAIWRFTPLDGWARLGDAPWSARMWPSVAKCQGRYFLYGGYSNELNKNLGDCWTSLDAVSWQPVHVPSIMSARHWPTMFERGEVMVCAGNAWPVQKDIWGLPTF